MYAFLKNMNYIYHFKDYRHMKKILNILIVLFMATGAYAQSLVSGSSSKTLQLLEADGSFLVKAFYDLATVKGVDCKVLIITDAFSGKKLGCMRLETRPSAARAAETYVGTLDADELDACIQALSYIREHLLLSPCETYTEAEYRTRDKVTIGAFFDTRKQEWTAYILTKNDPRQSMKLLDAESLELLKEEMVKARDLIARETHTPS